MITTATPQPDETRHSTLDDIQPAQAQPCEPWTYSAAKTNPKADDEEADPAGEDESDEEDVDDEEAEDDEDADDEDADDEEDDDEDDEDDDDEDEDDGGGEVEASSEQLAGEGAFQRREDPVAAECMLVTQESDDAVDIALPCGDGIFVVHLWLEEDAPQTH